MYLWESHSQANVRGRGMGSRILGRSIENLIINRLVDFERVEVLCTLARSVVNVVSI